MRTAKGALTASGRGPAERRHRTSPWAAWMAVVLLASALQSGCAPARHAESPTGSFQVGKPYVIKGRRYVPRWEPGYDRTGVASWYGRRFHGRTTANGETYNMNALSAAHPTLPFQTRIRVSNLDNGRELVLRINDRGPFARNRIVDVSRRAAEVLGFRRRGLARVRVQVIDHPVYQADSSRPADRPVRAGRRTPRSSESLSSFMDGLQRDARGLFDGVTRWFE